jgi:hypothetical protein
VAKREYGGLVRVKPSIRPTREPAGRLDRLDKSRAGLEQLERDERDRRDMAIINANADRLNREAIDALDYQRLS